MSFIPELAGVERTGDRRSRGVFLCNLGILNSDMENYKASMDYYRRAMDVSRETGDLRFKGWTLNNMGDLLLRMGDAEKASGMLYEAVEIFERIGERVHLAMALGKLGHSLLLSGSPEESVAVLERTCLLVNEMKLPRREFENNLIAHRNSLLESKAVTKVPPLPEHWDSQAAPAP